MRNTITAIAVMCGAACAASDRDWAVRVPCEMQTAGPASLPTLNMMQGTSPLLSLDQYRSGAELAATSAVTCVVSIGPTLTNGYYIVSTNYATEGNGYLVQLPFLGTNGTRWAYTAIFERAGRKYWTGNGLVTITRSDVTGDANLWSGADSYVPTGRTVTVNGVVGGLSSNVSFTVEGATNAYLTVVGAELYLVTP